MAPREGQKDFNFFPSTVTEVQLTRSISHCRIERRSNYPNIKRYIPVAQTFDMLEVRKGRHAGESPLKATIYQTRSRATTPWLLFHIPYLKIPFPMQFLILARA